jgi:hypothetical protein
MGWARGTGARPQVSTDGSPSAVGPLLFKLEFRQGEKEEGQRTQKRTRYRDTEGAVSFFFLQTKASAEGTFYLKP